LSSLTQGGNAFVIIMALPENNSGTQHWNLQLYVTEAVQKLGLKKNPAQVEHKRMNG